MLILGTYWFKKGGYSAHIPEAIKVGFNVIDIATHYGIVRSVGKAIKGKNILVNSKIWETEYPFIKAKIEEQYILIGSALNCMFLHWARRTAADYEAFINLNQMKKEGWIKKIGLCNVTMEMIQDFQSNTGIKPDIVQNESHIGHIDNKTLNYCKSNNIEYQGWGSMYGMNHPQLLSFDISERAKLSLAYLMLKGIHPIVFSTNPIHLEDNVKTIEWVNSLNKDKQESLIHWLEKLDNQRFGFTGRYPEQYISKGVKRPPIAEFKED